MFGPCLRILHMLKTMRSPRSCWSPQTVDFCAVSSWLTSLSRRRMCHVPNTGRCNLSTSLIALGLRTGRTSTVPIRKRHQPHQQQHSKGCQQRSAAPGSSFTTQRSNTTLTADFSGRLKIAKAFVISCLPSLLLACACTQYCPAAVMNSISIPVL